MTRFDRSSIVVYTTHQMDTLVINPKPGITGWAYYPKGFFGHWLPANNAARRSMERPKKVTYTATSGWMFDIELRMVVSRVNLTPVGFVYAGPTSILPAKNLPGTSGFLATTERKRVKVVRCA